MTTLMPDEVLKKIHAIPSLPMVVMELLATLEQEDVNIDALADKIAKDQALTAKTLRLANSSFYGMAHQITSIADAIAILGFRTVRSLATTAALIGVFATDTPTRFSTPPFWRHALAAAICARELAAHCQINPEHAYTAGLLHDIGRLVLVSQFPSHYEATMAYRERHDCALLDAEQAVLGLDHAMIGLLMARQWKLPEPIQVGVARHHDLEIKDMSPLSTIVIAANAIAHALDLSNDDADLVPRLPSGLWKQLKLDDKTLLHVFAVSEKQFAGASLVLNA